MYVRWKKRQSRAQNAWVKEHHGTTLSAELVESVRINGKPRQRVIAFIHSIKDTELESVTSRYYFWYKVSEKLKEYRFLDLTDEQKRAIVASLAKVVQPLTEEEFKQEMARTRSTVGEWSLPTF